MAIKGKAKVEMGTGDVRITPVLSDGIGAICLRTKETGEIGANLSNDGWSPSQSEVIIAFSDVRSIDVFIQKLHAAREFMQGNIPYDGRQQVDDVDLDSFMKE